MVAMRVRDWAACSVERKDGLGEQSAGSMELWTVVM